MSYVLLTLALLLASQPVAAIPPPEFLMQGRGVAGANLGDWILLLASGYVALKRWLAVMFVSFKTSRLFQVGVFAGLIVISGLLAYGYLFFQQSVVDPIDPPVVTSNSSVSSVASVSSSAGQSSSVQPPIEVPTLKADPYVEFLKTYYQHLSRGNIEAAYVMSLQEVSFATYGDWYKDVLAIQVEDVQVFAPKQYKVLLALRELFNEDRYEVNFVLDTNTNGDVYMVDSSVKAITPISSVTNETIDIAASQKALLLRNENFANNAR